MFLVRAFEEGGPFMYVILAFGIFTSAFIVERALYLYTRVVTAPTGFRQKVLEFIGRGDFKGAEVYAINTKSSVGNIVATGLRIRGNHGGEEVLQARMDEQLNHE